MDSKYCNMLLVSGSVISGIIGVILFLASMFASRIVGGTSSYILTEGTVKKAVIVQKGGLEHPTVYNAKYVVYLVEYIVNDTKYTGELTEIFNSSSQADAALNASKGTTKYIYYDPLAPNHNSGCQSEKPESVESIFRRSTFGMSVLLIGYAIGAFILR